MKELTEIRALYLEIDAAFEAELDRATHAGDIAAADRIKRNQLINDQAYFILTWGQLERAIDDVCRLAIRARQAMPAWSDRRGWDLFNPDDRRLSGLTFEERLALVVDRAAGRGSPWALAKKYYDLRNQIAHGTLRSEGLDVNAVIQDFYVIQGALAR